MKIKEAKFRETICLPGQSSSITQKHIGEMEFDEKLRMVVITKSDQTTLVPLENVAWMKVESVKK